MRLDYEQYQGWQDITLITRPLVPALLNTLMYLDREVSSPPPPAGHCCWQDGEVLNTAACVTPRRVVTPSRVTIPAFVTNSPVYQTLAL